MRDTDRERELLQRSGLAGVGNHDEALITASERRFAATETQIRNAGLKVPNRGGPREQ